MFEKKWDYRFGGNRDDYIAWIIRSNNGNIMMGGGSWSDSSGDKTAGLFGQNDFWIVNVDSNGNKIWDKTWGGNRLNSCANILETKNNDFLVGGFTNSDVSGNITAQPKDTIHAGDFMLFKIDSAGNILWQKRYGGNEEDDLYSMVTTNDGGYLLGGSSNSGISGDKSDSSRGDNNTYDYWIIKIDASGNKIWDHTYGGNNDDELNKIINTYDGGYLLAGFSYSDISGEKSQPNWDTTNATADYWVVRIDSLGNKIWDRRFGGTDFDDALDCFQMPDSGFMIFGSSFSPISGDKTAPLLGTDDYWVVRINKNGNKLWDKKYGGFNSDAFVSCFPSKDGGFLLGGLSYSGIGGDKSQANLVAEDAPWIVKIDSNGNKVWDKTLQINGYEDRGAYPLEAYKDNYYFVTSPVADIGGDKTQDSRGLSDYWISKWVYTDAQPVAAFQSNDSVFCANDCINFTNLSTNSTSWKWSFAGGNPDTSTIQNPQGICYAIAGSYDVSLIATNANGSDTLTISNYITVHPAPLTPTINPVGNTLYCVTNPSYTSYQWYFEDTLIAGATDTFYVVTRSGNYNVEVKNSYGCQVGDGINVNVGLKEFTASGLQFTISPNPVGRQLMIHDSRYTIDKIEIYNVLGISCFQSEIVNPIPHVQDEISIDVSTFSAGVYFVQVSDGTQRTDLKFVKE